MHRQSLGSPGSKHLNSHGVIVEARDDGSVATLLFADSSASNYDEDDEERKSLKRLGKAEKYVHLIPLLTVLCYLILYLSSHHPTDNDLAQFNGFNGFSKPIESGVAAIEKSNVLAIRSLRNLREIDTDSSKRRFHRKIADF
nr:Cysteine-rich venom protein like [Ipomoea batatas]